MAQEHVIAQLPLVVVLNECLFDLLLSLIVAREVIHNDFLMDQVLEIKVHLEDSHHQILRVRSVKAEEQLTSVGLELGANIIARHSAFDLKVLCHQVQVVVIKVNDQHYQSIVSAKLSPGC